MKTALLVLALTLVAANASAFSLHKAVWHGAKAVVGGAAHGVAHVVKVL